MFPEFFTSSALTANTPAPTAVTVGPTNGSTTSATYVPSWYAAATGMPGTDTTVVDVAAVTPIYKRPAVLVGAGAVALMVIGLIAYSHSRSARSK